MSWFSNAKNAFLSMVEGKSASTNIIDNPTTPLEMTVNAAASVLLPAAAALTPNSVAVPMEALNAVAQDLTHPASASPAVVATQLGASAKTSVQNFLTSEIGAGNTQLADAGLQALATFAISAMSSSSNKTEQQIAIALDGFTAAL